MNNSENSLTLKIYILLGLMSFIFLSVVDCSSVSDIDSLTKVSEYKNPNQNPKDDTDPNKNPKLTSQEKWDQFIQSSEGQTLVQDKIKSIGLVFLEWQPKDLLLVHNDGIAKELKDDTDAKRDGGSLALLEKKSVDYLQNQISNLEKEITQAINQKQDSSITIDSIKNNAYILSVKDIQWSMMIKQKIESIEKLKENLAESQLKENAYKQYQKSAATFYVYQDWVKR